MTPSDNNSETARAQRRGVLGGTRRRAFLKALGAGVATTGVVGAAPAAASNHDVPYSGPFGRTYDAAPVSPETVERVTTEVGDDGEGEGEENAREIPRKAPQGDDAATGTAGEVQRSVDRGGLVVADFDGLGSADVRGVVPSDNQVAVGPDHVVQAINSRWGIFEKETGEKIFEVTLDDWWQNVSPVIYEQEAEADGTPADFFDDYIIFDPRARYDAASGHFILACVEFSLNMGVGAMLLSVSATDDPNGTWYNYRAPAVTGDGNEGVPGLVDFPELGFDGEAIYLTQNFFPEAFQEATMVALDKTAAYAGETVDANHFTELLNPDGSPAFTVQPAAIDGQTPGRFVNSRSFQGQSLTAWTLRDPVGDDPTLENGAVRVRPYHNAPAAEQPQTEEQIDTLDTRINRVAFDGDHLWATHTVGDGRTRWYEVDPSGPSLVQSGNFKRHGRPTFLPAIEADADGNAVLVYNTSTPRNDSNGFVNAEVAARTADTPDGKVGAFEVVEAGVDDYDYQDGEADEPDAGPQVMRWGDYNGVAIDPVDGSFWITAQYTPTPAGRNDPDEFLTDNDYGTRIAKIAMG